jgi:hypothetical protein
LKIIFALVRGHTNVGFLIILAVFVTWICAKVSFPRLTVGGEHLLNDIKVIYAGLKGRASRLRPGGATLEVAMLAACFGVAALAGESFGYVKSVFPRAQSSSGPGSSCGHSCGSSCGGGGGGGGCGGGGCGGGCGGCGGGCGGCGS